MAVTINASTSTGLVQSADTSGEIELQSNGTTALKVNTNEGIQILNCLGVGGATPSTSGAGITFPATQSASSNANTLDDYEEGTWTPVFTGGTVSGTLIGTYTKIGRQVTVLFELNNATLSGSPDYRISGLPFTNSSTRSTTSALAIFQLIGTGANTGVAGIVLSNDTTMDFVYPSPSANWTAVAFRTGVASYLHFSATYFTA